MSMWEWLVMLSLGVVSAVFASLGLHWRKPGWTRLRKTLVGAAIVPGSVFVLCGLVFLRAATSSFRACGVDACGMAMMAASYMAFAAGLTFLLGWACAYGLHRLMGLR